MRGTNTILNKFSDILSSKPIPFACWKKKKKLTQNQRGRRSANEKHNHIMDFLCFFNL